MKKTLSKKLIISNAVLISGLLIVGAASVYGLIALRKTSDQIAEEYEESRIIENVIVFTSIAQTLLKHPAVSLDHVDEELKTALVNLDIFVAFQEAEDEEDEGQHQDIEASHEAQIRKGLLWLRTQLDPERVSSFDRDRTMQGLNQTLAELNKLLEQTDVAGVRAEGEHQAERISFMISIVTAMIIIGSILLSVFGYRSVILPLREMRSGVHHIASGEFSKKLSTRGDHEFASLAHDFNQMANELHTLYQELEEKIQEKSRELVRSERLASVGFLAAGVAHEINNPLSIISGYAEMSQKWLAGDLSDREKDETRDAMQIIHQEAFRCKGIIQQLLSLSRMGDGLRGELSIRQIAEEVVNMLSALEKYRPHTLVMRCEDPKLPSIMGNEPELKQVILNLTVNALESLEHEKNGKVTINLSTTGDNLQLSISDNGVGMTPDILDRIFEPFFTHRSSTDHRGTGLGLSICHAIIESHHGTIRAESDGPSQGSRFTITLPGINKAQAHAD